MTSTQEPNTMAPQSALCIRSREWQAKSIVPIYFGTKTPKFCLRIISFSSLGSELNFELKDSEINFDRARAATQCEITALSFRSNLQFAVVTCLHISKLTLIGCSVSRLIAQICYKYCEIRRYSLSLVSLQIADWLSAEILKIAFESLQNKFH